jgi:uncharacterized membrane protein
MVKSIYALILPLKKAPVYEFLLLAAITLTAGLLRFYKLGEWSFWGDEVFTLSRQPDGFSPSLARGLIHFTTATLGTSEWSARLAPAMIGILSIPVLYFIIQRPFGTPVALAAAALLAVSPWHIYWSQNARFYSLLFLFYSAALLIFYIGLEEDNRWFILASLVLLGLAAQERLLALLFLPVAGAYLLMLRLLRFEKPAGNRLVNLGLFFAPGAAVSLLFAGPYLMNLPSWISGFGRINNNPFWLSAGVVYYVGLPVVCFALIAAVYLLLQRDRGALYLSLAAIVPFLLVMALSLFQYTANRYVFISLLGWILLSSLGIKELLSQLNGSGQIFAAGVLILLLASSFSEDVLYFQFQNGNRDNWKAAFAFLKEHKQPGDLIVSPSPDVGRYYLGEAVQGFQTLAPSDLEGRERVWFVEDLTVKQLYPQQYDWLARNARQVASFDVRANARIFVMRVYLYESRQSRSDLSKEGKANP